MAIYLARVSRVSPTGAPYVTSPTLYGGAEIGPLLAVRDRVRVTTGGLTVTGLVTYQAGDQVAVDEIVGGVSGYVVLGLLS